MLFSNKQKIKKSFLRYSPVRLEYIIIQACTHFKKDREEPAPLFGLDMLDIGCGTSPIAEELVIRGVEATAVDCDTSAISKARNRAESMGIPVKFRIENVESLIQENKRFDIILCMDIFDHVEDLNKFVWIASKLLKQEGLLIFSAKNHNHSAWFWHILIAQNLMGWTAKGECKHKHFRSPNEIAKALKQHGLKTVDTTGIYFDVKNCKWGLCKAPDSNFIGTAVKK